MPSLSRLYEDCSKKIAQFNGSSKLDYKFMELTGYG